MKVISLFLNHKQCFFFPLENPQQSLSHDWLAPEGNSTKQMCFRSKCVPLHKLLNTPIARPKYRFTPMEGLLVSSRFQSLYIFILYGSWGDSSMAHSDSLISERSLEELWCSSRQTCIMKTFHSVVGGSHLHSLPRCAYGRMFCFLLLWLESLVASVVMRTHRQRTHKGPLWRHKDAKPLLGENWALSCHHCQDSTLAGACKITGIVVACNLENMLPIVIPQLFSPPAKLDLNNFFFDLQLTGL